MIILPEPAKRLLEVAPSKSADPTGPCDSRGMIATLPTPVPGAEGRDRHARRPESRGRLCCRRRSRFVRSRGRQLPSSRSGLMRKTRRQAAPTAGSLRVEMDAGLRADRSVLRLLADHRPIRGERYGKAPHHLQEFFESTTGASVSDTAPRNASVSRCSMRMRSRCSSARWRSAISTRSRSFACSSSCVRSCTRRSSSACAHAQRVFVFPKLSLGGDTLGDIEGVAENVWRSAGVLVEDVAVHPHARASVAGNHAHQPGVLPIVRMRSR